MPCSHIASTPFPWRTSPPLNNYLALLTFPFVCVFEQVCSIYDCIHWRHFRNFKEHSCRKRNRILFESICPHTLGWSLPGSHQFFLSLTFLAELLPLDYTEKSRYTVEELFHSFSGLYSIFQKEWIFFSAKTFLILRRDRIFVMFWILVSTLDKIPFRYFIFGSSSNYGALCVGNHIILFVFIYYFI